MLQDIGSVDSFVRDFFDGDGAGTGGGEGGLVLGGQGGVGDRSAGQGQLTLPTIRPRVNTETPPSPGMEKTICSCCFSCFCSTHQLIVAVVIIVVVAVIVIFVVDDDDVDDVFAAAALYSLQRHRNCSLWGVVRVGGLLLQPLLRQRPGPPLQEVQLPRAAERRGRVHGNKVSRKVVKKLCTNYEYTYFSLGGVAL